MDNIPHLIIEWKIPKNTMSSQKTNNQQEVTLQVYGMAFKLNYFALLLLKLVKQIARNFIFMNKV